MMSEEWLKQVEVFFGDANNAEARVYARLPGEDIPSDVRLLGRVIGPTCAYAHTLSAAIRLNPKRIAAAQSSPSPPAPLSEAIVPDPCFWSAELPFLYQVEVELHQGETLLETTRRTLGIRPLGVHRGRLMFEGRPWVVRAARSEQFPACELSAWRAADLAMFVESPTDELCAEASRQGVILAVQLPAACELPAELGRLARWTCVAIAICQADSAFETVRPAARNLIVAQRFGPGDAVAPAEWAELVVVEDSDAARLAERVASCGKPVVACRPERCADPPAARRACDQLQRELAGRGEFAGYLV